MNYFIEGKSIYLRALSKADISKWFDWFNDSLVTELMNKGIFPNTELAQEKYYEFLSESKNDIQLGICLKDDDKLIGTIGIHNIDWVHRHGEVSILIGEKMYWKKGIASETISLIVEHAFLKMNLRRLTAGMPLRNKGSKKCFEKNFFTVEGKMRKHLFLKGIYEDVCLLGLIKEEWGKKNKGKATIRTKDL